MPKTPHFPIPTFSGSKSDFFPEWFKEFQSKFVCNEWDVNNQVTIFQNFLVGAAKDYFETLTATDRGTLNAIEAKFKEHFVTPDLLRFYQDKMAVRKQHPNETVAEFGQAIDDLGKKAYYEIPEQHRDLLLREKFIAGLRASIRELVQFSAPKSFAEAMSYAERKEYIGGGEQRSMEAILSKLETLEKQLGKDDIGASKASNQVAVVQRRLPNHMELQRQIRELQGQLRWMRQSGSRGQGQRQEGQNQGQPGQFRRPPGNRGPCYNCGRIGHFSRECWAGRFPPQVRGPGPQQNRAVAAVQGPPSKAITDFEWHMVGGVSGVVKHGMSWQPELAEDKGKKLSNREKGASAIGSVEQEETEQISLELLEQWEKQLQSAHVEMEQFGDVTPRLPLDQRLKEEFDVEVNGTAEAEAALESYQQTIAQDPPCVGSVQQVVSGEQTQSNLKSPEKMMVDNFDSPAKALHHMELVQIAQQERKWITPEVASAIYRDKIKERELRQKHVQKGKELQTSKQTLEMLASKLSYVQRSLKKRSHEVDKESLQVKERIQEMAQVPDLGQEPPVAKVPKVPVQPSGESTGGNSQQQQKKRGARGGSKRTQYYEQIKEVKAFKKEHKRLNGGGGGGYFSKLPLYLAVLSIVAPPAESTLAPHLRFKSRVFSDIGMSMDPKGLMLAPAQTTFLPILIRVEAPVPLMHMNISWSLTRGCEPVLQVREVFNQTLLELNSTYAGIVDTKFYATLLQNLCSDTSPGTFCYSQPRQKRFAQALIGGSVGLIAMGIGIGNSVEINRLKGKVDSIVAGVEKLFTETGVNRNSIRKLHLANENLYTFVHDSVDGLYTTLNTLGCELQTNMQKVQNGMLQQFLVQRVKEMVNGVMDASRSGLLSPLVISVDKVRKLVEMEPAFANTLYQQEPALIYQLGNLYPVLMDIMDLKFGFILEVPLATPAHVLPLLEITSVGWNSKESQTTNRVELPRFVTTEQQGEHHKILEIRDSLCSKRQGLWLCKPAAVSETSMSKCLNNLVYGTSVNLTDIKACELSVCQMKQETEIKMTRAGVLLRTNLTSLQVSPRTNSERLADGQRVNVPENGVFYISHNKFQILSTGQKFVSSAISEVQEFVVDEFQIELPSITGVVLPPVDWTPLEAAIRFSADANLLVQKNVGPWTYTPVGYSVSLWNLALGIILAVIAVVVCLGLRKRFFKRRATQRQRLDQVNLVAWTEPDEVIATTGTQTSLYSMDQKGDSLYPALLEEKRVQPSAPANGTHHRCTCPTAVASELKTIQPFPIEKHVVAVVNMDDPNPILIKLKIEDSLGTQLIIHAMVDTGSSLTLIAKEIADKLQCPVTPSHKVKATSISGHQINIVSVVLIKAYMGPRSQSGPMAVVPNFPYQVVLGRDFLKSLGGFWIDLAQSYMQIGNYKIPFLLNAHPQELYGEKQTAAISIAEEYEVSACVAETQEIPAWSQAMVTLELTGKDAEMAVAQNAYVEPRELVKDKYGILLLPGVIKTTGKKFFAMVLNPSRKPVTLRIKMVIATILLLALATPADTKDCNGTTPESYGTAPTYSLEEKQAWLRKQLPKLNTDLKGNDRLQLEAKLVQHADIFSISEWDIGHLKGVYHKIDTGEAKPIAIPKRRLPASMQKTEAQLIDDQKNAGVIEQANSPWSFQTVIVPKKDGTKRLAINYKPLNNVTIPDAYPLKNIKDILSCLKGKFFVTLDMKSAYHHVEIHPDDRNKTAFSSTRRGQMQYIRLPFGLKNAPAEFTRQLETKVLMGLDWNTCLVYLDDVVIWADTVDELLSKLDQVFKRFREHDLRLKLSKCSFGKEEIIYLGHRISAKGVRPDPAKIKAIIDWPEPKDTKALLSFMGTANYLRDHVSNFAIIAKPLYHLLKNGVKFQWADQQRSAFQQLKNGIAENVLLTLPDWNQKFYLNADASDTGCGAKLYQMYNGKQYLIAFASHLFSETERKYSTIEKEALAIIWAIENFDYYLYGRQFHVLTDHKPLVWLFKGQNTKSRLARWVIRLLEYDFTIGHIAGKDNVTADALSRIFGTQADKPQVCKSKGTQTESSFPETRVIAAIETLESDKVQQAQDQDPLCKTIMHYIQEKKLPPDAMIPSQVHSLLDSFFLDQNNLLKLEKQSEAQNEDLLVIPQVMVPDVLFSRHDHILGGHQGIRKTFSKISSHYYWPSMYKDVLKHCKTCRECQQRKSPQKTFRAPLKPIPVNAPWHRIEMDIVGPLPQTRNGNRYILVFIEMFTKWPECFAMPDMKAERIANILMDEVICRYGMPLELLTDQGANVTANVIKDVCQMTGIKKTQTTAYHPQTNAGCERFNRSLYNLLCHYVSDSQDNWDIKLPKLLFAYRSAMHMSTKQSPFFLLFGRNPKFPLETSLARGNNNYKTTYGTDLALKLQKAWESVAEEIKRAQQSQKQYYDLRVHQNTLMTGDQVLLHHSAVALGTSKKLSKLWKGPFLVENVSPDGLTITVRKPEEDSIQLVHINRLKPFFTQETPQLQEPQDNSQTQQTNDTEIPANTTEKLQEPKTLSKKQSQVVWAKLTGYPWWPAIVTDWNDDSIQVTFFDKQRTTAKLPENKVKPFIPVYKQNINQSKAQTFKTATKEALEYLSQTLKGGGE